MTWPQQVQSITCLATTSGGGFGSTTNELKIMNGLVTCYPVGGWIKWCVRKYSITRMMLFSKGLTYFQQLDNVLISICAPSFYGVIQIDCKQPLRLRIIFQCRLVCVSSCLQRRRLRPKKKVGVGGRRHSLKRRMAKTLMQKSGRDDDDIIRRPPNASWATILFSDSKNTQMVRSHHIGHANWTPSTCNLPLLIGQFLFLIPRINCGGAVV